MRIPLTEPTAPRYISINPETNLVHLMLPVVGGQEISTDNTCKGTAALRDFFVVGALRELNAYTEALAFDIQLLEVGNPQRIAKEVRLAQIEAYIGAVSAMQQNYDDAMTLLMTRSSNLYGIQLRPRSPHGEYRVFNPTFNIKRDNDDADSLLSALYNVMHSTFPGVQIVVPSPRKKLTTVVLSALPLSPRLEDIQSTLGEKLQALYGVSIDFTQRSDFSPITKDAIDDLMGFDDAATSEDYIDTLLGICAPDVWESILTPPFYNIPAGIPDDERTERLSILTQFFLSIVNIHCRARGISSKNFGTLLDASHELSNALVSVVVRALSDGDEVEGLLCDFCNLSAIEFGLSRTLDAVDVAAIKQKFERTYRTVTATKENPYMDDFMILDLEATGELSKFVIHQGAICTDFTEIVEPSLPNQDYFARVRADFAVHPAEMPHKNEWVAGDVEIEPEALLARITDDQFDKLPDAVKVACRAYPTFQKRRFLPGVAEGRQDEVDLLLTASPANKQDLLRTPGVFTDYSGRIFNCTAYEYAYWAKDTHMCQMLERHMDDKTKTYMLARIDIIERIDAATGQPVGLEYLQGGLKHRSAHFDLTPLKDAMWQYVYGYDHLERAYYMDDVKADWMRIGILQRDMPVHVVSEYCRPNRPFNPIPEFNDEKLPRNVGFYYSKMLRYEALFPLVISDSSGLGVDFVLVRGGHEKTACGWGDPVLLEFIQADLAAISLLDEGGDKVLRRLRENLRPTDLKPQRVEVSRLHRRPYTTITDDPFEKPYDVGNAVLRAHPTFQMHRFLSGGAKGHVDTYPSQPAALAYQQGGTEHRRRRLYLPSSNQPTDMKPQRAEVSRLHRRPDTTITNDPFEKLPDEAKAVLLAKPSFQKYLFLSGGAKGQIDTSPGQPVGLACQQRDTEHRRRRLYLPCSN